MLKETSLEGFLELTARKLTITHSGRRYGTRYYTHLDPPVWMGDPTPLCGSGETPNGAVDALCEALSSGTVRGRMTPEEETHNLWHGNVRRDV